MTSKNFIFQTGHAKGLARIEIEAILGDVIKEEVKDGFLVEAEIPDPVELLSRMGSTVRITEVIQSGPSRMPLNFEEWVVKAISEAKSKHEGKFRYGLSMHPKSEKVLKNVLIGSKKKLKATGNVRFVNKDFQNLSSVQAWHQKLLKSNAMELHLFQADKRWYLSHTVAIQNFEWYSERDYERPSKSAKNGMFPPKLAQILINLAQAEKGSTIFDPFCGSGTVLQEALLMGYEATGSDLVKQMVEDSEVNLKWLLTQRQVGNLPKYKLFEADATKLTADQIPANTSIVTETWLGPMLTKELTELERPKVQREV
ncbi:hypothetical protein HOK22_01800, partial [Candidatus Peregrinibacteria bacterium]|nr:hypothetical protein [Candidatus Peregrinibacteria bacterium]